jgi:hypothetical protein
LKKMRSFHFLQVSILAQTRDSASAIIGLPECGDRTVTADSQLQFHGRCEPVLVTAPESAFKPRAAAQSGEHDSIQKAHHSN